MELRKEIGEIASQGIVLSCETTPIGGITNRTVATLKFKDVESLIDQVLSLIIKRVKEIENPYNHPKADYGERAMARSWDEAIQVVIKELSNG